MQELGKSTSDDAQFTHAQMVRFDRVLSGPPERTWAVLADTGSLPGWYGAGHIEPRAGGGVELMGGLVLAGNDERRPRKRPLDHGRHPRPMSVARQRRRERDQRPAGAAARQGIEQRLAAEKAGHQQGDDQRGGDYGFHAQAVCIRLPERARISDSTRN